MKLMLRFMKWRTGMVPGPPLTMAFRGYLVAAPFRHYMSRSMTGDGPWTRGEREIFGAYVSKLNTCHF